jgi:hypothetical protein
MRVKKASAVKMSGAQMNSYSSMKARSSNGWESSAMLSNVDPRLQHAYLLLRLLLDLRCVHGWRCGLASYISPPQLLRLRVGACCARCRHIGVESSNALAVQVVVSAVDNVERGCVADSRAAARGA